MTGAQTMAAPVVLSVDAMGGDNGPGVVVDGVLRFLAETPSAQVLLHGPESALHSLIRGRDAARRIEIADAAGVVAMTDKPSHVMRHGRQTSMWHALEAVRDSRAQACLSCGNTGALMAIAMLRLGTALGVTRPAIACLWPSQNRAGFNVMLDVGADIRADQDDLLAYAQMGAFYARHGLGLERPRIGLLNVGVEEHKGKAELQVASEMIAEAAANGRFDYVGFVEGSDIPSDRVDVIVTDGFTGNIALKTGEATAGLVQGFLTAAFRASWPARLAALLARGPLRRLSQRIDPRQVNGGVFLGLDGTVVKSHGSADATGVAAALKLAYRLAEAGFSDTVAAPETAPGGPGDHPAEPAGDRAGEGVTH